MRYLILGNIAFAILSGVWWRLAGGSPLFPAGVALIACGIAAGYLCGFTQASKQHRPAKPSRPMRNAADATADHLLRIVD